MALVITGALLLLRALLGERFEPVALLQTLRGLGASIPVFLGVVLIGTTLFVPAVVFFVVAGALWGFGPGLALGLAAIDAASWVHFAAGRSLGRARVKALLEKRQVGAGLWRQLEHSGLMTMLLIRQLPLPFVGVNAAAGASPIRFVDFLIGSGVGVIPNAVVYTWFAAAIAEGVEGAREEALVRGLLAAGGVLLVGVSTRLLARWLRARGEA